MAYYLDISSPKTYERFSHSDQSVTRYPERRRKQAARIQVGDKLICYLMKIKRWVGILEVIGTGFRDTSIDPSINEELPVHLRVKPILWLAKEQGVPIQEDFVWDKLSFTRGRDKRLSLWTGPLRTTLFRLSEEDGFLLENVLQEQAQQKVFYSFNERKYNQSLKSPS